MLYVYCKRFKPFQSVNDDENGNKRVIKTENQINDSDIIKTHDRTTNIETMVTVKVNIAFLAYLTYLVYWPSDSLHGNCL